MMFIISSYVSCHMVAHRYIIAVSDGLKLDTTGF